MRPETIHVIAKYSKGSSNSSTYSLYHFLRTVLSELDQYPFTQFLENLQKARFIL